MQNWTPAEWENLLHLSAKLQHLLAMKDPLRPNRAWETQLRLTLEALSMYCEAKEKR